MRVFVDAYSLFGILYFDLHKEMLSLAAFCLWFVCMFKVNSDSPSFIFFLFRANWRKGRPSMWSLIFWLNAKAKLAFYQWQTGISSCLNNNKRRLIIIMIN